MSFSYKHLTVEGGVACGEQNVAKSKQSPLHMRVTCPLCQAKANLKPLDQILNQLYEDSDRLDTIISEVSVMMIQEAIIKRQASVQQIPCGPTGDAMYCACGCGGNDTRCDYWKRQYELLEEVDPSHTCCKVWFDCITCPDCDGLSNTIEDMTCGTCGCAGYIPAAKE